VARHMLSSKKVSVCHDDHDHFRCLGGTLCCRIGAHRVEHAGCMGELRMASLKQWFGALAVSVMLMMSLTSCVVAPAPVPSGYEIAPPAVVIRPYYPYPYYYAYPYYRPHHRGWYPYRRW
jgi:hypothetical protein